MSKEQLYVQRGLHRGHRAGEKLYVQLLCVLQSFSRKVSHIPLIGKGVSVSIFPFTSNRD